MPTKSATPPKSGVASADSHGNKPGDPPNGANREAPAGQPEEHKADSSTAGDSAAAPKAPGAAETIPNPPFRTAKQINASTPSAITWLAWPLVVAGGITALVGKVKSAGKSTLIAQAVAAVLAGKLFLGKPTVKTPVVWLTEENDPSFRELLGRAKLLDRDDLVILSQYFVTRETWPQIVERAIDQADAIESKLVVVDTPSAFTGMTGEAENDAGESAAVVRTISELAGPLGIGVLLGVHERKSGGDIGDAARGSSGFIGAVDHIGLLRRHEGAASPNVRRLETLGRFGSPSDHLIELTDEGYVLLGTLDEVKEKTDQEAVLNALPTDAADALTVEQLGKETEVGRTKLREILAELENSGAVLHTGYGRRGSPFRYFRSQPQPTAPVPVSAAAGGPPGAAAEKLWVMLCESPTLVKIEKGEAFLRDECDLTEDEARDVIEQFLGKLWEITPCLDEDGTLANYLVPLPKGE